MEHRIILETWFETGLGDFYACLIATKVGYDHLINLGYDVEVRINSRANTYGIGLLEEHNKFLNEHFNLKYFNDCKINTPISDEFIKVKNVQYSYNIYVHKNSNLYDVINEIKLYGYSVENVATTPGGWAQPYPPKQNDSLLSDDFIQKLNEIKKEFGEFYSIFFRFSDDKNLSEDELIKIREVINNIVNENEIKNVFISSRVESLRNLKGINANSLSLNLTYSNNYERVVYDLINMCLFSFSKKIYCFRQHWTNYLTFALFNNESDLKYEDFIIERRL